jgi:pimeloyl-ACP methyl ester carboxylesterase
MSAALRTPLLKYTQNLALTKGAKMAIEFVTETHGEGDPVLFIHGLGGTSNVFSPQVATLSRFFKCIRPDLPGSGRTPAAGPQSLVEMAEGLAQIAASEGGKKVHVVAHSLGTVVATHLAAAHPELVRSLALIGPLLQPPEPARGALRDRAAKARAEGMTGIADAIVQGGTSAETKAARPEVAALVREILMRQDAEGYALTCEALADAQSADTSRINVPTLLVTGDEDGTAPPRNVRAMQSKIAGSRLQILGRTGHWTTFERPAEVTEALVNFLLSVD